MMAAQGTSDCECDTLAYKHTCLNDRDAIYKMAANLRLKLRLSHCYFNMSH